MILLFISFISGLLTVLAPCILPVLPIIVGGSLVDGKIHRQKVFTIVTSLIISIVLFTFLLKVSTVFIDIPSYFWQWVSGGIIIVLGVAVYFPRLWNNRLFARINQKSHRTIGRESQKNNFFGDVMTGAALGPIFSTCSPTYFIVLASVLPVRPVLGFVYLVAYSCGLALALLIVTFAGQKILKKLNLVADAYGMLKKSISVLFIIIGFLIITGIDKKIEAQILQLGYFDVTKIEHAVLKFRGM